MNKTKLIIWAFTAFFLGLLFFLSQSTGTDENMAETSCIVSECDVWVNNQCLDQESKWFGADLNSKATYNYCKNKGNTQ